MSDFFKYLREEITRMGKHIEQIITDEKSHACAIGSVTADCLLPDECESLLSSGVIVRHEGGTLKSIEVPVTLTPSQRQCILHVRGCAFCQSFLSQSAHRT